MLFRIDPERFSLALRQAEATVAGKQAAQQQAAADYQRYSKLSELAVTQQKLDEARATALVTKAAYDQAVADRDVAKLNLARSEVRAAVSGRITNMELRPGNYVAVGHGVMALIDSNTLRVEGYFEETKLPRIHVGDAATVRLMGEAAPLTGQVESIAGGIEDRERSAGANLLANVNPTFLMGSTRAARSRAHRPRSRAGRCEAHRRPHGDGVDRLARGRPAASRLEAVAENDGEAPRSDLRLWLRPQRACGVQTTASLRT